ncbi:hypothetical protein BD779DRAFT_1438147, partial [Infundibulicybe gibba]
CTCAVKVAVTAMIGVFRGRKARTIPSEPYFFRKESPQCEIQWASSMNIDRHRGPKAGFRRTPSINRTLYLLSQACRTSARKLAASSLFITVYDNINMMIRVAEQIVGRKNAQENGTCATVIPLHNVVLDDLRTDCLDSGIMNAPPLRLEDLQLTQDEATLMDDGLVHTILAVIVKYGGDDFAIWKEELKNNQPKSSETIDVHQTQLHPLPAMEIDENTITGNIEIVEEINTELHLDTASEEHTKYVKLIAGDQLTIARQRSIMMVRLGHEVGLNMWKHLVLVTGLFHAKIADCHGIMSVHLGVSSTRSPGSLAFHNTCLDRLPIVLTSLPSFHTCRDLIMHSLYARVLHCLLLVSSEDSLESCAKNIKSWSALKVHAKAILTMYANADRVQELREPRLLADRQREALEKAKSKPTEIQEQPPAVPTALQGDMVFENGCLFLRDALLTRLFADAVKAGDSGLVILVLKMWTFSYRGNGRTKYAHEMLHLMHNLIHVWSEELRKVVIQNWLLNPTGRANAFVEIDLVQEHLNFWIKKIYKADGDSHSWDWLALVSPCIDILRKLSTKINNEMGAQQGSKHTIPDLRKDLDILVRSLNEHRVYRVIPGRIIDPKDKPVPDVISVGLAALAHGNSTNPIADFNKQFNELRERRKLTPVSIGLDFTPPQNPEDVTNLIRDVTNLAQPESDIANSPLANLGSSETPTPVGVPSESDTEAQEAQSDLGPGPIPHSPTLQCICEEDVALEMDEYELDGMGDEDSENPNLGKSAQAVRPSGESGPTSPNDNTGKQKTLLDAVGPFVLQPQSPHPERFLLPPSSLSMYLFNTLYIR